MGAPPLTGQSDWYLYSSIKKYKASIRGSGKGDPYGAAMIGDGRRRCPDDDAILDVIAHIQSLSRAVTRPRRRPDSLRAARPDGNRSREGRTRCPTTTTTSNRRRPTPTTSPTASSLPRHGVAWVGFIAIVFIFIL